MTSASRSEPQVCPECHALCGGTARYCAECGSPLSTKSAVKPRTAAERESHLADPLIGRVIADRYRITEEIGRGGMGVVYRVEHARIGKLMALKLLSGELTRDPLQIARFKREAQMASQLSHPNTVQVFDFGISDGLVYLAMEYLRGEDLGHIVRREGSLSVERTTKLMIQVSGSLAEAHGKGIIHRDLKPENILVVPGQATEDLVKVLDFGLAKLRESNEPLDVTLRGAIVGTPYYMSPEQIRGENVGQESDIYALGALMYMCLTGVPVFDAQTAVGVFTKHLLEAPIPPHVRKPELGIPEGVSALVVHALAKDPQARPRSAIELRNALLEIVSGRISVEKLISEGELRQLRHDTEAATRDEVERYERKLRRRGRLAWAAVAVGVLGVLGVVGMLWFGIRWPSAYEGREREPNDLASQASDLRFGSKLLGKIGRRIDLERSDRDFFRVDVPASITAVRLSTRALPNFATCTWLYAAGAESPLGRYCSGAAGRDLVVAQLAIAPGSYLLAVMQDRDAYTRTGAPPVLENVSDDYELELGGVVARSNHELEPNDSERNPNILKRGSPLRGSFAFMRDVDVFCAHEVGSLRFVIADLPDRPRSRDAVLEVTPLSGPTRDVPVRVHAANATFPSSPRDIQTPFRGPWIVGGREQADCVQLTLRPNPWSPNPPEVAPASDSEYEVTLESQ
ncbi:MAG TPA: serine/threonine-protein kinase [Polyangiaceae bacterium]|nr:serine/threonine-protein kinase [Polyangiaceae bacterium]